MQLTIRTIFLASCILFWNYSDGCTAEKPENLILKALDLDKNQELSEKEIRLSSTSLQTLDLNKNKQISRKEWQPKGPKLNPASRLIRALDVDGNAELSETEIRFAPRLLRKLDRNRDKKISKNEWQLR